MFISSASKARRALPKAIWVGTLAVLSQVAVAGDSPAGRYRIQGGPDVASELILSADGRFQYFLSAGSLDEEAQGAWKVEGDALKLTTIPKPVPAVFSMGPSSFVKDRSLDLHVTNPAGRGLASVHFILGFETGHPITGYTQDYGWSMDPQEKRTPRWIELTVPIFGLRSNRFPIDLAKGNRLTFILTPNDLGTVDFEDVQIDIEPRRLIVHRGDALIRYEASDDSAR